MNTMMNTTAHPMAPTDAERSAIEAGLAHWETIEWVEGEQGHYLAHEQMEAIRFEPVIVAAAEARRAWEVRTCPTWCTSDHERLSPIATAESLHTRVIGQVQGTHGSAEVTLDMTYSEDGGVAETSGPILNLTGCDGLSGEAAAELARILLEARDILAAAQV